MLRKEMGDILKRRFKVRSICPVCGQKIEDFDDVQFVAYRNGKCKLYTFFHTSCLVEFEMGVKKSYG